MNPYPNDYHSCVEEWIQERDSGADRELKTVLPNLSRYDIIYLCYPIWSGTIPTPVKTMLKYNDFSGKLIMPVASHGGGGAGRSATDIARLLPKRAWVNCFPCAVPAAALCQTLLIDGYTKTDKIGKVRP